MHVDNKKKYFVILGKGTTQRLDDTALTTEAQYLINFTRPKRKFF